MHWERCPEGLAGETAAYRLLVQVVGGSPRFLVLRHPREAGRHPNAILASGRAESIEAAMEAATGVAARMEVRSLRQSGGAAA